MVNLELICHSDYLGDQVFLGFNDAKVEGRVVALDDINPVSMKHHTNTCSPTHRCLVIKGLDLYVYDTINAAVTRDAISGI